MQHVASRESLLALTSKVLEIAEPIDDAGLAGLGRDLDAVSDLLLTEASLRRTLSEGTIAPDARAGIAQRLLAGQIAEPATSVVQFAVRQVWSAARDLQEALRRVSRTAMFLRAERSGDLDDLEDELFRFARIVDAHPDLSVILDDPTTDPTARAALTDRLLEPRAHPLTRVLVGALARDTGGRSFSHGLGELVEQAAERRDKLVAIVHTASPLGDDQISRLVASLRRLYNRDVSVHTEIDPAVLGGLRVEVAGEVIDGSVATKLEELRRRLAG